MSSKFPSDLFPGYHLQSIIAKGSYGVVWKVRYYGWTINIPYAFKIILIDDENEARQKERDARNIPKGLHHPNIVKIMEITNTELTSFQVSKLFHSNVEENSLPLVKKKMRVSIIKMEPCGENLRTWLKMDHDKTSLATKKIQRCIVKNLIDGMRFLKARNIIHGHLHPENILFTDEEFKTAVKIGGYGSRRNTGTDLYKGHEPFSFRGDLYSLGLIIWEVIQLIPQEELRNHFDQLGNGEEDLILLSDIIVNLKEVVTQLCKGSFHYPQWGPLFQDAEAVAKDTDHLLHILKQCEDNTTIHLLKRSYEGAFEIKRNKIRLIGQGRDTTFILQREGFMADLLTVSGNDFEGANFRFVTYGQQQVGAICITGSNCTLDNIEAEKYRIGVKVTPTAKNTTITNATFTGNNSALRIYGKGLKASNLTMQDCQQSVEVFAPAENVVLDSLNIDVPGTNGISFQKFHSTAKLLNVTINCEGSKLKKSYGIIVANSPKADLDLENVICTGFTNGLCLDKKSITSKVTIKNSKLGKILKLTT